MNDLDPLRGLQTLREFPLLDALLGRRSRRFFQGARVPDGVFAYDSRHPPLPLSELETLLVVGACGGCTGWQDLIYRADRYAPHLSNYAAAAGGRTFPSAAGFHTSQVFFTDDTGVYLLDNRDAPPNLEHGGPLGLGDVVAGLRKRVRKLQDGRLGLPPQIPYVEPHNTWVVNHPGTLLVSPVGDLAQHVLLVICYLLQNGYVLTDDVHRRAIPGIERFRSIVDVDATWPLSFVEQWCMAELTVELGTSCYAGMLLLQAMGLGGWMFNGIDPFSFLGASGQEEAPGLGFRHDVDDRWPTPNPTGLPGVMEGFCPPHFEDMRQAVDALCERKFGRGGPFSPETPGPWKDPTRVRGAAQVHDATFRECVAFQAQYVFDTFGRFPATVPSIFVIQHLQAHHLDLEFYDRFYEPGAYLPSHAQHMAHWHAEDAPPRREP